MATTVPEPIYLSLSQACPILPPGRGGARVHAATLTRWILAGVRAVGGRRVRLRAVRCGSRWLVTREWLDEFLAECAGPAAVAPAVPQTAAKRRRSHERATAELEMAGI